MHAVVIGVLAARHGYVGPFTGQGSLTVLGINVDHAPGFTSQTVVPINAEVTYGPGFTAQSVVPISPTVTHGPGFTSQTIVPVNPSLTEGDGFTGTTTLIGFTLART